MTEKHVLHLGKMSSISASDSESRLDLTAKLYIPSTLNIRWHTQLIVCAENVKSWFKSWVFPFTFQAYILPY